MSDHATTELETWCPHCLFHGTAVTSVLGGDEPHDGMVNICLECGIISVFDASSVTRLRKPAEEERRDMLADPGIQSALRAWMMMHEMRRGG